MVDRLSAAVATSLYVTTGLSVGIQCPPFRDPLSLSLSLLTLTLSFSISVSFLSFLDFAGVLYLYSLYSSSSFSSRADRISWLFQRNHRDTGVTRTIAEDRGKGSTNAIIISMHQRACPSRSSSDLNALRELLLDRIPPPPSSSLIEKYSLVQI